MSSMTRLSSSKRLLLTAVGLAGWLLSRRLRALVSGEDDFVAAEGRKGSGSLGVLLSCGAGIATGVLWTGFTDAEAGAGFSASVGKVTN